MMSNNYDDGDGSDDYFNDHDDDGKCTMDYVRDVKKKLPNLSSSTSSSSGGGGGGVGVKAVVAQRKNDNTGRGSGGAGVVNDRVIIKKLIELEYDVDAVVSFFKKKQQQQQSQKQQQQQPTTTTIASMSSASTINSNITASGAKQPQSSKGKESGVKQSSLVSKTDHDGDAVGRTIVTSTSSIPLTTVFSGTSATAVAGTSTSIESDKDPSCASLKHSRTQTAAAVSDDEDVVDALKMMSMAPGKVVSDGRQQQHHHQLDGAAAAAEKEKKTTIPHLTMVVTGHVDAGKSTLVGHLLFKCGLVSKKTIHKYEKESKAIGR